MACAEKRTILLCMQEEIGKHKKELAHTKHVVFSA